MSNRLLKPKAEVIVVGRDAAGQPTAEYGVVLAIHDEFAAVQHRDGVAVWYDRDKIVPRENDADLSNHADPGDENVRTLNWQEKPEAVEQEIVMRGECDTCGAHFEIEEDHIVVNHTLYCWSCGKEKFGIVE